MSKNNKVQEEKVSKDLAIKDLEVFLKKHMKKEYRRGQMTREKIEKDYEDVIEAMQEGLLVMKNGQPEYTLREPLFNEAEKEDLKVKKVTFRSRVKAADKNRVLDGLNLDKQAGTYVLKYVAYITQLSMTEINQLEQDDFDVLNQICSVF